MVCRGQSPEGAEGACKEQASKETENSPQSPALSIPHPPFPLPLQACHETVKVKGLYKLFDIGF